MICIIITVILSRYLIYLGMKTIDPTIVHLIISLSVFVTFSGTVFILKKHDFHIPRFIFGIILILSGTYFVQLAHS